MNNGEIVNRGMDFNDRRHFFRKHLPAHSRCLSFAHGQIWTWKKTDLHKEIDNVKLQMFTGLICLVEEIGRNKKYYLQVYCNDKFNCLYSSPIEYLKYISSPQAFLDSYESKECMICLNYCAVEEGEIFRKTLDRTIKKIYKLKKDVAYAKRIDDIYLFFEELGIKENDVIDSKTRSYIFDLFHSKSKQNIRIGHGGGQNNIEPKHIDEDMNKKIDEILSEVVQNHRKNLSNSFKKENISRENSIKKISTTSSETKQAIESTTVENRVNESKNVLSADNKIYYKINASDERNEFSSNSNGNQHNLQQRVVHNNDSIVYSTIVHKVEGKNIIKQNSKSDKDDDKVEYADLQLNYNSNPLVKDAKAKFQEKKIFNEYVPQTKFEHITDMQKTSPPPIPPKLKKASFKLENDDTNKSISDGIKRNYQNYVNVFKVEDKGAPLLPKKGKLLKQNIGSPGNFRHVYGFAKWE